LRFNHPDTVRIKNCKACVDMKPRVLLLSRDGQELWI
jgi:hypothetical protein